MSNQQSVEDLRCRSVIEMNPFHEDLSRKCLRFAARDRIIKQRHGRKAELVLAAVISADGRDRPKSGVQQPDWCFAVR